MATHITVRMAWHDNNWNGRVCRRPEDNVYCVGTHSLLSERLARNKKIEIESDHREVPIDQISGYLPPCFWTTNAFSADALNVRHDHAFSSLKHKSIQDKLGGFSSFTWPFRLSFNHSKKKKGMHGNYPPDLERRIDDFLKMFTPNLSIVFFYLNYDNPVSADENKYVLVGCESPKRFQFTEEELAKWRKKQSMQHFPSINWAVNVSYDFQNAGVLLPYKEYLEYVEEHPQSENLLSEMRVLIEEEALIPSFKYVATDIDDDKCIYLLTKLRKSLEAIKEHGITDVDRIARQLEIVDMLLAKTWQARGLYPSLGRVLDIIAEVDEDQAGSGDKVVALIRQNLPADKDLLEQTFGLILGSEHIPAYLKPHESYIEEARSNVSQHHRNLVAFKKLSLIGLTRTQLKRIIFQKDNPFKKKLSLKEIAENPYLLCEDYVADEPDLDKPEQTDAPIGIFKVDIAMFPDSRYLAVFSNMYPNSSRFKYSTSIFCCSASVDSKGRNESLETLHLPVWNELVR
jgi:hypothetical protein